MDIFKALKKGLSGFNWIKLRQLVRYNRGMSTHKILLVAGVVVMVAVVVGVDVLFFRERFWERLIANIGIVMVFAAFYLRFLM